MGTCAPIISAYAAAIAQQQMLQREALEMSPVVSKTAHVRQMALQKFPSCGSREFKTHHDKRICSYCRSEVQP